MGIAKILAHETKNEKGVSGRGEAAAKKQLQGRGGCRKIRGEGQPDRRRRDERQRVGRET